MHVATLSRPLILYDVVICIALIICLHTDNRGREPYTLHMYVRSYIYIRITLTTFLCHRILALVQKCICLWRVIFVSVVGNSHRSTRTGFLDRKNYWLNET